MMNLNTSISMKPPSSLLNYVSKGMIWLISTSQQIINSFNIDHPKRNVSVAIFPVLAKSMNFS